MKLGFASKIVFISIVVVVVVIHKKVEEDCAGDIQTMAWGLNLASWPLDSSWHGIYNSQEIKAYFEHDHSKIMSPYIVERIESTRRCSQPSVGFVKF